LIGNIYALAMQAAAPLLRWHIRRRVPRGKEIAARIGERFGEASLPRPSGKLIWCHAASVGEAISLLTLIAALLQRNPAAHVLVTSGTVTSATILRQRLPAHALHQFVPLDRPGWVKKFLDHWRPDLAIWVESELWPNMLEALKTRGIPAALVNGRLSARSARHWRRLPSFLAGALSAFGLRLAQSEEDAARFSAFAPFAHVGNLKYAVPPTPIDEEALKTLRAARGARPVWLAAGTHEGEEDLALAAHEILTALYPDLLTAIVPRHPERGAAIAALCAEKKIAAARRGEGALPGPDTAVYIADTLGELGAFYALAPVAYIGGSFHEGSHSPAEAALAGCVLLHGPDIGNNEALWRALGAAGVARQIDTAAELAAAVAQFLCDPEATRALGAEGRRVIEAEQQVVARVIDALQPLLAQAGLQ
jgi:3-deoxy-D-manno-octulosonic-acid transferase